jgi:hypothetical protein
MTRFISVQMLYYFYRLWIGIKKLLVLIEMARQVSSKKILFLLDIFYIVFTASMVYLLTYPLHPRWDTRHPSMVYLLTYPLHPRWDTRHPSMVYLLTYPLHPRWDTRHPSMVYLLILFIPDGTQGIHLWCYLLILFIPGGT